MKKSNWGRLKISCGIYCLQTLWWWPFWLVVVVLACISLIMSYVEYHYTCFLALSMSSLENCLFKSTTHFYRVTFLYWASLTVWRGCGDKGTLLYSGWGYKLAQLLWRKLRSFLLKKKKKITVELPYDPAIPLLSMYLEKAIIWKYTCTPVCIAALFTVARTWKQP